MGLEPGLDKYHTLLRYLYLTKKTLSYQYILHSFLFILTQVFIENKIS